MTVQALAMLQSVALAVTVWSGNATVGAIYVLAACQGVLTAFDNPTRRSFVVEMVPPDEVTNAVSLNSAVMTGSRVVGPALAGVLVITVGFGWAFMIDAISYLAVLAGLFMMRTSELYTPPRTPRAKGQVREGLRYIRRERQLFVPLVMMAIVGTLAFNFSVTIPLLVTRTLGGSDGTFTILFSVLSLGSLVGALWTARRDEVTSRQLVGSAAAFGLVDGGAGGGPHPGLRLPGRHPRRPLEHRLHDVVDGDRPGAGGAAVPRPGARHPVDGVPRQHADRRPDRRLGRRRRRAARRRADRRRRLHHRRRLRRPGARHRPPRAASITARVDEAVFEDESVALAD